MTSVCRMRGNGESEMTFDKKEPRGLIIVYHPWNCQENIPSHLWEILPNRGGKL